MREALRWGITKALGQGKFFRRRAGQAAAPLARCSLTRLGAYYLLITALILLGAMWREVNLLVILAGMLLGPLWINWRMVKATLRGIEVQRRLPREVWAGEQLLAELTVRNTRRRLGSWAMLVEDELWPQTTAHHRGEPFRTTVLFVHVPAGGQGKGFYRGRLNERGRYRVGPLRIGTQFPFGLFRRTVTVAATETLVVLPRLGVLQPGWTFRRQAFVGTRRHELRHGTEGDFSGLRTWQRGDSRRWVHWRSTARRGELLVRQFEQPRNRDVALLLDPWQPPQPSAEQRDSVELAVSFAATVATDLCRRGASRLYLITWEDRSEQPNNQQRGEQPAGHPTGGTTGPAVLAGPSTAAFLHEVLERLAVVGPQRESRAADLLACAMREVEPGTELILVSTAPVALEDPAMRGHFSSDPKNRALLQHVLCVDTSSAELSRYFQP
jgi:uncharacterized protein (DUF58 family)